jgi:hypothetical protein
VGPGLAARAKVERYRDLYAIQIPPTPEGARGPANADDSDIDITVERWDDDEEDREEMLGVLDRFHASPEGVERGGSALERNDSRALRRRGAALEPKPEAYLDDDEVSRYPDDERPAGRATMYKFDNARGGGRETMYSQYSRASFMDTDKSEEARGRLVDRVGVMFDLSGRERSAIPPVPRLPPAMVAGGNRF